MKRTPLQRKTGLKAVIRCKHKPCRNIVQRVGTYCSDECKAKARKAKKRGEVTVKKLDDLWSKLVRQRDGKCLYCGTDQNLQAHHIYSRINYSTRWLLANGITLCCGCHTMSSRFSAHKTPIEFTEWLRGLKGQAFIDGLREKARSVNTKLKQDWWDELNREERG